MPQIVCKSEYQSYLNKPAQLTYHIYASIAGLPHSLIFTSVIRSSRLYRQSLGIGRDASAFLLRFISHVSASLICCLLLDLAVSLRVFIFIQPLS